MTWLTTLPSSPFPVITGIGHERDESVADLVAAYGLKTPTAVAEFLVDKFLAFEFRLSSYRETLSTLVGRTVKHQQMRLERLAGDLIHLSRGLSSRRQGERLDRSGRSESGRDQRIPDLPAKRSASGHLEAKNELVNPVNVLKRGYSMTLHQGKATQGNRSTSRPVSCWKPGYTREQY